MITIGAGSLRRVAVVRAILLTTLLVGARAMPLYASPAATATKTVSGTFTLGSSITYTIVLTNFNACDMNDNPGHEFNDVLPVELTLVSASADSGTAVATLGTNTVTWNGIIPASGGTVTITINATIIASTSPGTLVTNQGEFNYDADFDNINETMDVTDDPGAGGSADPTYFIVLPSPATVTGTQTVTGTFRPGGAVTYTVVLTNAGPSTQLDNPTNEFSDTLPATLVLVSAAGSSGTAVATIGTRTVTWNGSIANGASVTITIHATIGALTALGTAVANQGTASFDVDGNATNESTAFTDDPAVAGAANPTSFIVTSPSTLSTTMTVSGTFIPGGAITYTAVISNTGPAGHFDNPGPEFFDGLSPDVTLVSASASSGTAVATIGTRTVTWDGSIANGASVTVTIHATIDAAVPSGVVVGNHGAIHFDADGDGTNETTAISDDPSVGGAEDPTLFTVAFPPTLTATKSVIGTFTADGAITYTVVISSSGGFSQADNAGNEFTDVLPASLTLVSASSTSGMALATAATNTVTWNGSVAANGSITVVISATIRTSTVGGTAVTNQGTISFDADGDGTNESSALTDDPNGLGASDATTFTVLATSMPFIDLNGDGLGDVVLYNVATGAGAGQVNDGTGGFTATAVAWDAGWQVFPIRLNGDVFTDIFFYHPVTGAWVQALNHAGDGTFTYTVGIWDPGWQVYPADLNGDAITDLFVYNSATGVWVKSFVDGDGGFANYTAGNWDPRWTFTTADLNGDGRDDFFLYNQSNGVWVEAFSQAGVGTFDYPASGQWDLGWQIYPADLDGDHRTDLVLFRASGLRVSALSRAVGGFDYPVVGMWETGWAIVPGDLDHDGRTDLFFYNAVNGMWQEALSDGMGDFTYHMGRWDPNWTVGLTDFNGDGRADILASNALGFWVQATNTGTGTFAYTVGNWGTGSTVFTQGTPVR